MRCLRRGLLIAAALWISIVSFRGSLAAAAGGGSTKDPRGEQSAPQDATGSGAPANPQLVSLALLPPPDPEAVRRGKQDFSLPTVLSAMVRMRLAVSPGPTWCVLWWCFTMRERAPRLVLL